MDLTAALFASVSLHVLKNRLKIHLKTELNDFQFRCVICASKKFVRYSFFVVFDKTAYVFAYVYYTYCIVTVHFSPVV